MNWETIEGQWDQLKGKIREKWGKLTDNDLEMVKGKKDKFLGLIQERYGNKKDEILHDIDLWAENWKPRGKTTPKH